jgi:hypothetical protein
MKSVWVARSSRLGQHPWTRSLRSSSLNIAAIRPSVSWPLPIAMAAIVNETQRIGRVLQVSKGEFFT